MESRNTLDHLTQMVAEKNFREAQLILKDMQDVDIALFLDELPAEQALAFFRMLPKERAAEVFSYLASETQESIINAISDQELSHIVEDMSVDDAVDMVEELPANVVKRVLKNASKETRALINHFLQYPEDSVGSIMTAEFTDLKSDMTVADAIHRLRTTGEDRETIYTCYIIGHERFLSGVLSVKDLLLARDEQLVADIMDTNVITAHTTDARESAVQIFQKYDLLSLPVVDKENRLVGIVTIDDAMDVMEEETTRDFEHMAAMQPLATPYMQTGVFTLARKRIVWLFVLMLAGTISGGIISRYELSLAALPILVQFIPMLMDTGGNSGAQASTMVIRGMSLGEIHNGDWFRVLWKELRVGLLVGAMLGAANFVRLCITYRGQFAVAFTMSLAIFLAVIIAKTVGAVLPVVAKVLRLDPAIVAAPMITTVVDACSLLLYFNIAKALLPM